MEIKDDGGGSLVDSLASSAGDNLNNAMSGGNFSVGGQAVTPIGGITTKKKCK